MSSGLVHGAKWDRLKSFSREKLLPVMKKAIVPVMKLTGTAFPEIMPLTNTISGLSQRYLHGGKYHPSSEEHKPDLTTQGIEPNPGPVHIDELKDAMNRFVAEYST